MGLLVSIGHVTTSRTRVPYVVATIGNNLGLGQVGNRGHPFAGIGSIRPRTEHGCVLLDRLLGPALYETPLGNYTKTRQRCYSLLKCPHYTVVQGALP